MPDACPSSPAGSHGPSSCGQRRAQPQSAVRAGAQGLSPQPSAAYHPTPPGGGGRAPAARPPPPPLAGPKEGPFLASLLAVPATKAGRRPAVLLPNPFYVCYQGGAGMSGGEPVYLDSTAATGFLPDLDAIDEATLERTALFYLVSPGNPQGACASLDYLKRAILLSRKYDFVLALDECYAEIYDQAAPVGGLEACAALGGEPANVLGFHSLSKRSSAAGLRAGVVARDPALIAGFVPLPTYSPS